MQRWKLILNPLWVLDDTRSLIESCGFSLLSWFVMVAVVNTGYSSCPQMIARKSNYKNQRVIESLSYRAHSREAFHYFKCLQWHTGLAESRPNWFTFPKQNTSRSDPTQSLYISFLFCFVLIESDVEVLWCKSTFMTVFIKISKVFVDLIIYCVFIKHRHIH